MRKISENEFDEIVKGKGTVLVDFYTEWCGPCNILKPILEDLSEKVNGVTFTKVDVAEEYLLGSRFKINHVPTMILLKDGEEIARTSSMSRLEEWIESNR